MFCQVLGFCICHVFASGVFCFSFPVAVVCFQCFVIFGICVLLKITDSHNFVFVIMTVLTGYLSFSSLNWVNVLK